MGVFTNIKYWDFYRLRNYLQTQINYFNFLDPKGFKNLWGLKN